MTQVAERPAQPPATTTRAALLAQAYEPKDLGELIAYANLQARNRNIADCYKMQPENIVLAVQMGAQLGLTSSQSLVSIAVVGATPTLYGDGFLGVVLASPQCKDVKEWFENGDNEDVTTWVAHCRAERNGREPVEVKYTHADAVRAKLWGKTTRNGNDTPWITNPKRMMQMRARRFACSDQFADVLKGIRMYEEVVDYVELNVTPKDPGPEGGRAASVKDRLRDAGGMAPEGELEPPMPQFHMMVPQQIRDAIDAEVNRRGMPKDVFKVVLKETLKGRPLNKTNAVALTSAVRRWVAPEGAVAPEPVAEPAAEPVAPSDGDPVAGTEPLPGLTLPAVIAGHEHCFACLVDEDTEPHDPVVTFCGQHGTPTSECENPGLCRTMTVRYERSVRPASDAAVCSECGGNGWDGGDERSEAPCGMCNGSGKARA